MEAYVGHFAAAAMDWLIVTGALACGAALLNAGIRYWYALGREGILPRALGRTHPKHKTPHVAILFVMVPQHDADPDLLVPDRLPLEMYGWLAVQGVIWIVLVQALDGAVDVLLLPQRASRPSMHRWKTIAAPWIGFLGPGLRAAAAVLEPVLPRRRRVVREPGVRDPVDRRAYMGDRAAVLADRHHRRARAAAVACATRTTCAARTRAKYEILGRFINQGAA